MTCRCCFNLLIPGVLVAMALVLATAARATPPVLECPPLYAIDEQTAFIAWPWLDAGPPGGYKAFTAVDLGTGKPLWHIDTPYQTRVPPLLLDGMVFTSDPPGYGTAREARTGKILWTTAPGTSLPAPPPAAREPGGFVAAFEHAVVSATGKAYDAGSGKLLWDIDAGLYRHSAYPSGPGFQAYATNAAYDRDTRELAVVTANHSLVSKPFRQELLVLDAATGAHLRVFPGPGAMPVDTPTFAHGTLRFIGLTFGGGRFAYSIDTHSGAVTVTGAPVPPAPGAALAPPGAAPGETLRTMWPGRPPRLLGVSSHNNLFCLEGTASPAALLWKQAAFTARPGFCVDPMLVTDHEDAVLAIYPFGLVLSFDGRTGAAGPSYTISPLQPIPRPAATAAMPSPPWSPRTATGTWWLAWRRWLARPSPDSVVAPWQILALLGVMSAAAAGGVWRARRRRSRVGR